MMLTHTKILKVLQCTPILSLVIGEIPLAILEPKMTYFKINYVVFLKYYV